MKEALLYAKLEHGAVRCGVCSHRCVIPEGRRGVCRVRENRGGTLYALNYGRTVAAHIDPIEKKPLYHFLPGTRTYSFAAAGCNFRCGWCQNWAISQIPTPAGPVEGEEVRPEEHVRRALLGGCPSISYTYSEPTVFLEYALDTMKAARKEGLKNIWVSNGFMSGETLEAVIPCLDAANIDCKGPEDLYARHCGGSAAPVRENLKRLIAASVHVEVTTLLIPGLNDGPGELAGIAGFIARELGRGVPWHVSRYFPAFRMKEPPPTPLSALSRAAEIGRREGLAYIHLGNV